MADSPISMLEPATGLTGVEAFPVVQDGKTLKTNPLQIRRFALNDGDMLKLPLKNFLFSTKTISATSYTLLAEDTGYVLVFTSPTQVTITLPNSFDPGWNASIVQAGSGKVVISLQNGSSILSRSSYDRTAGQGAAVSLAVISNPGAGAQYLFQGDGALS